MIRSVALGAAAVLAFGLAAQVLAHAEPVRVKPGDGALVNVAPSQVELTMSQEMARLAGENDIDVFDAAGKEVTTAGGIVHNGDRRRLSVALPSNLAPGTYSVKWKTRSADDGDAASGSLSFTFDPNGTPNPGKEVLRADLLAPVSKDSPAKALAPGGGDGGTSWVLVVAVGVAAFVLGGGGAYLLIQKRP